MIDVERQVRAVIAGEANAIRCPYCEYEWKLETGMGHACCMKMAEAVNAVLDHIEFNGEMEKLDRVMNHLSDMQAKEISN